MEGSVAAEERAEAAGQTGGGDTGEKPPAVPEDARRAPDAPDTVQESIARAREAIEQGGSILDLEEAQAAEDELAEGLEAEAAREESTEELEAEAEEKVERPELVVDEEDMLPEDALPEGWKYDENRRLHRKDGTMASLQEHEDLRRQFQGAGEEEPTAEAEDGAEEEELEDEIDDELVVEIPGREPGETEQIMAEDPEMAERLRQLANSAMRREEFNRQMESLDRERQEFREVTEEFTADPAAFLVEKVKPEIKKDVALRLLADDDVFNEVQSTLRQWDINPDKKRADLAELEKESYKRRDQASRDTRIRQTARSAARRAREHMETLMDEAGVGSGPAATKLMKTGMSELGQAMMEARRFDISLDEAKKVLDQTGTLDLLGLSANGSGGRSSSGSGSSEESASPRRVRAVDPDSEEAKKARRTGKELKSKAESRRAAAAAPQGAGASAAGQVQPPEGQSVKERIKWAREKGLGAILSGQ